MPKFLEKDSNLLQLNSWPLSEIVTVGKQNLSTWWCSTAEITKVELMSVKGTVTIKQVPLSLMVRLYWNPEEIFRGPTRSVSTVSRHRSSEGSFVRIGFYGKIFCNSDTWGSVSPI